MSVPQLSLLLPLVLAAHNAEEYRRFDEFIRMYPRIPAKLRAKPVVRGAMILLTLAGTILGVLTRVYRTPPWTDACVIAGLALMVNAFGHVGLSIRLRFATPGTVSAVILVLPYSAVLVSAAHLPCNSLLHFAGLGLLAAPGFAALFLVLGYFLSRVSRVRQHDA